MLSSLHSGQGGAGRQDFLSSSSMRCSRLMQSIQHHDHCRLDSRTAARGIGGSSQHEDDIGLCPAVPQSPDEDDVIKQAEEQMFQFDLDDQDTADMNGGLVSPADAAADDDIDSDTEIKVQTHILAHLEILSKHNQSIKMLKCQYY